MLHQTGGSVILACAELHAMFVIQTVHHYIKVFICSVLGLLMYGGLLTKLEMLVLIRGS